MKRTKLLFLILILLVPVSFYFSVAYCDSAYPCVNDVGGRYAPAPNYSCAPDPALLYVKTATLFTNGTFQFLVISGGRANISQISIVPNSTIAMTTNPTNMTCNGLMPVDHSPITERCVFQGIVISQNVTYFCSVNFNVGDGWGGLLVPQESQ
jgi:hypothetical protein